MAKRRMSKASKRRLTLFGTISLVAIVYFLFSLVYNAYTIYDLSMEKKRLETLYTELQDEAETLKIDIEKLNDANYLANYAREHYRYSKDGEYIIQIDSEDLNNVENEITKEINKNYIIIGVSVIGLMFIYILIKTKKNKKK